jgi:hypothetical protein
VLKLNKSGTVFRVHESRFLRKIFGFKKEKEKGGCGNIA